MRRMQKVMTAVLAVALLAIVTVGGAALAQTPTPNAGTAGTAKPWIGVSLMDLGERAASRLGISQTVGVAVVTVTSGSPADKAGVKPKDVVTAVDGKPVAKASDVTAAVAAKKPGDSLVLSVARDGKAQELPIGVGKKPDPAGKSDAGRPAGRGQPSARPPLGSLLGGPKNLPSADAFGRMLGGQWRFLDKDNNPVTVRTIPGTVVTAAKDSLTIKPNDSSETGGPFAITAETQVRLSGNGSVESLKPGDQVVVTTTDGKSALSVTGGVRAGFGRGLWDGMDRKGGRGGWTDKRTRPETKPTPGTTK